MQSTRATLDGALLRLSSLELDDFVTMHDITEVFYLFETLITAGGSWTSASCSSVERGRTTQMQREEFVGGMTRPTRS